MTNAEDTKRISRNYNVLTNEQIHRYAPAVFTDNAAPNTSDKYKFYDTCMVLNALREQGWLPFQAMESRSTTNAGYQKHSIRFRMSNTPTTWTVGDTEFNLLLINSHDGKSSYQLHAGLYRLVCSNGLIVSDRTFEPIRLRHQKLTTEDVIEASYRVIDEVPRISDTINEMQSIVLSEEEQVAFARAALQLRWESETLVQPNGEQVIKETAPIRAERLLTVRRYGDNGSDLYRTFNRVQENLLQGGLAGRTSTGGRTHTRQVLGVDANTKLNKALFTLAEEMRAIKQG